MAEKHKSLFVYKLAKLGAVSIGVVYLLIGVLAILSFLQLKEGGTGRKSVFRFIAEIPLGNVLLVAICLGLAGYIVWKLYDAYSDPYGYGKHWTGLFKRFALAFSSLAYGLIAVSAVQVIAGITNSNAANVARQRLLVARIFDWWAGQWLVAAAGAIVGLAGLSQFIYVIKKAYREKLRVDEISERKRKIIASLAWAGHFARGIILLVIAYFLIKAAVTSDSGEVVSTDKAFDFLGDEIGHIIFILVALGTICYGLYMFALSFYFDFEDDF